MDVAEETLAERRKRISKAYIEKISVNRWVLEFVKNMNTIDAKLIAIKHRAGLPSEVLERVRGFARELGESVGATVALYPENFDCTSIRSMPRDQAIRWVKDLARAIGCELFDPAEMIEDVEKIANKFSSMMPTEKS